MCYRLLLLLLLCCKLSACQIIYTKPLPRDMCFATTRPNIPVIVYPQDVRAICTVKETNSPYFIYRPRTYNKRNLMTPPYNASSYFYHSN